MLALAKLGQFVAEHHTSGLSRRETLPHYNASSVENDVRRFVNDGPEPNASGKAPFLTKLRADNDAGKLWRRVHTVTHPLSDYLRYRCEWGYAYNVAAGEAIRILDLDRFQLESLKGRVLDSFVIDRRHLIRSVYDETPRFAGAEIVTAPAPYLVLADVLWSTAEDFTPWNRHPRYHQKAQAA